VDSSLWSERLLAALASFFAAVAALLAGIGIYGLLSFLVAHSTHEIGIRMALGAGPLNILRMVSLQTFAMGVLGASCSAFRRRMQPCSAP